MSNSYAIAAVTATLRKMILDDFNTGFSDLPRDLRPQGDIDVSTLTLDKAHDNDLNKNRINLFLYQIAFNVAWRNRDMPGQVKPGETGQPPLALNLYYLITAYGEDDNKYISHILLGRAMQVLHENPLLKRNDIEAVLGESRLQDQVERVRITPLPTSLDDMSKLWMTLQTQYRVSAAYQVEVVLIDSKSPVRTPLPVLTLRPPDKDKGIVPQPDLTPPFPEFPALTDLVLLRKDINGKFIEIKKKPSVEIGDLLRLEGHHLDGDLVKVRFINPLKPVTIEDAAEFEKKTDTEIIVKLGGPDKWVPGFYTAEVIVTKDSKEITTNQLPLALAPKITIADLPSSIVIDSSGDATLDLNCTPQVNPKQRASLLLNDREILAKTRSSSTDPLTFLIKGAEAGKFFVRLRVDGVDSVLVKDYEAEVPEFDPDQQVTISG